MKEVTIGVKDSGIGINKENMSEIFKAFNKIDLGEKQKLNLQGCGVGLALSNSIAKALGPINNQGIIVESEKDKGSTFSFVVQNQSTSLGDKEENIYENDDMSMKILSANTSSVREKVTQINQRGFEGGKYSAKRKPDLSKSLNCPPSLGKANNHELQGNVSSQNIAQNSQSAENNQASRKHARPCPPRDNYRECEGLKSNKFIGSPLIINESVLIKGHPTLSTEGGESCRYLKNKDIDALRICEADIYKKGHAIASIEKGCETSNENNLNKKSKANSIHFHDVVQAEEGKPWQSQLWLDNQRLEMHSDSPGYVEDTEEEVKVKQSIEGIKLNNMKQRCSCPQVLIVDDQEFNLFSLSLLLKQFYQISSETASNSSQVMKLISSKKRSVCCQAYRIVFMDINMPDKSGYEVAYEIKKFFESQTLTSGTLPTTIIACSAYNGEEDKKKAFVHGMVDFVTKPIMKNDLDNIISKYYDLPYPSSIIIK